MYIKCKLSKEANSVVSKIGDVQIFHKPVYIRDLKKQFLFVICIVNMVEIMIRRITKLANYDNVSDNILSVNLRYSITMSERRGGGVYKAGTIKLKIMKSM